MSCFCQPPLQSPFSFIPTSAPFSSVSASPSYLFLPSHLICGVTGGGFPQWGTGGRNNDWASNSRFEFPHLQMVAAAAASLCVCVYARRGAGRHRLEKRQPLPSFSTPPQKLSSFYGASFPEASSDHTGLLLRALGTAPKRFFQATQFCRVAV